jgi:hypothetical protein
LAQTEAVVIKRVIAFRLEQAMQQQGRDSARQHLPGAWERAAAPSTGYWTRTTRL